MLTQVPFADAAGKTVARVHADDAVVVMVFGDGTWAFGQARATSWDGDVGFDQSPRLGTPNGDVLVRLGIATAAEVATDRARWGTRR